jgi:hypothetical protein
MSVNEKWNIRSPKDKHKPYEHYDFCRHCLDLYPPNHKSPTWHAEQRAYGNTPYDLAHMSDGGGRWLGFYTSVEMLMEREAAGCRFCTVLLEGLMLFASAWEHVPADRLKIAVLVTNHLPRMEVYDEPEGWSGGRSTELVLDFFTAGQTVPWPWPFRQAFDIADDPLSTSTKEFLQSELQHCRRYHGICGQDKMPLPRRVLDVGDASKPCVRLHEPGSRHAAHPQEAYATLSHCWGGEVALKTTKSTIEVRKGGIPWGAIPRTFQDAIRVTRWLGLRYLWIDSLCIVQDDAADWEHESARMADIYQGSELTIVATRAPNSTSGFLGAREVAKHIETDLPAMDGSGNLTISVRKRLHHPKDPGGRLEDMKIKTEPCELVRRGWCFQERILGTRLLHFTPSEVVFECQSSSSCECLRDYPSLQLKADLVGLAKGFEPRHVASRPGPESSAPSTPGKDCHCASRTSRRSEALTRYYRDPFTLRGNPERHGLPLQEEDCVLTELDLWLAIVQRYTACRFTFDSDILIALSGIASRMAGLRQGSYMAGLWEEDIARALTWNTLDPATSRRVQGATPSWSWASRTGRVLWMQHHFRDASWAEVVEASAPPRGPNPFADVQGGRLVLRAKVMWAQVTRYEGDPALTWAGAVAKRSYVSDIFADTAEDLAGLETGQEVCCLQLCAYDDVDHPGKKPRALLRESLNREGRWQPRFGVDFYVVMALVLKRVSREEGNEYRRVGVAIDVDPYWFQEAETQSVTIL